jgi:hypothetical protein
MPVSSMQPLTPLPVSGQLLAPTAADAPAIALRLCACLLRARRDGREQDGRLTRATPATSGSLAVSCRSLSLSEVVSISGVGRSSGAGVSTERVASKVKSAGEGPERVV